MNRFLKICFLLSNFNYVKCQLTTSFPNANLTDQLYQKPWTVLEKKLLTSYVRSVRPVKNDSTKTFVKLLPFINHIEEVNEEEQTMNVHGFLYMEWYDEFLTWDLNEFSGLDRITIPSGYIWQPDLMLYNSASGTTMGRAIGTFSGEKAWVYYDGKIIYFPQFSLKATCLFDYSNYPYDVQQCPLILGSWSYTLKDMEITQFMFTDFVQMTLTFNDSKVAVSNWEVLKVYSDILYWDAHNRQRPEERPPESQFQVVFTEFYVWIKLRRWAPYFGAVVLMPAVMTSFFTLASFWTKSFTTGIILLMVNMMIQAVFTNDLIQKLPPSNGSIPRIAWYFSLNLTVTVVSAFLLGIIQVLTGLTTDQRVPPVLRHMVYGRRMVSEKINQRFAFIRQVDEDDDDDDDNETLSKNVENQQHAATTQDFSVVSWLEIGNVLKMFFFIIFSLFYLFSMFVLLC